MEKTDNTKIFRLLTLIILLCSIPISFATQLNLTYDGNGNLITGDGKYRTYNEFNQLMKVYNESNSTEKNLIEVYIWHPTEDRILVKYVNLDYGEDQNTDETVAYIDENFVKSRVWVPGNDRIKETYYIRDDNGLVAEVSYNTTQLNGSFVFLQKLFYHPDHLSSTSAITNMSGGIVEETFYDPYGAILGGGNVSRYSYEGKEFSITTNDYDYKFRKYNPEWGIFTQPDALIPNVYDPQQLNKYSFERRNPYKYIDENGKWIETALDIGFISYDISQLGSEEGRGDWVNWASLGADVAFAIIPFATGGGALIRGGEKLSSGLSSGRNTAKISKEIQSIANQLGHADSAVSGTLKHSKAEELLINKGLAGIFTEVSIKGGQTVSRGTSGSLRLDIIYSSQDLSKIGTSIDSSKIFGIYDYKFGVAGLTSSRVTQISGKTGGVARGLITAVRPGGTSSSGSRSLIGKIGGFVGRLFGRK